jgi:hypothetical protein
MKYPPLVRVAIARKPMRAVLTLLSVAALGGYCPPFAPCAVLW